MERLTERTSDGILVKEYYGEDALKTLYQCFGVDQIPHYTNCDEGYCAMEKLAKYEDFEEQGKLIILPCDTVWFICDIKTRYATVMPKSIRDLSISDIEGIDNEGYYWSTRDKALSVLKNI